MTATWIPVPFVMPGGVELLVVLAIVLLLFGATKIPELARSTGKARGEFKRGRRELKEELREQEEDAGSET